VIPDAPWRASASAEADYIEDAKAAYLETSQLNLLRIGRLLAVLRRFDEAGLPTLVLKGAALALRYYQNYRMRAMADVDVLVRPADVGRAAAILADLGWTADGPGAHDLLPTRMRLHHAWSFSARPAHNLDLHWRVINGGGPEVDDMFRDAADTIDVGSTTVRVLGPTDQMFHVCVHALIPSWAPSPRWIVDAATVLDRSGGRIDWMRLVDLARRTNTTVRLYAALVELRRHVSGRIAPCVLDALRSAAASRWERRELALFSRRPPFSRRDVLRWHWYQSRRLRPSDSSWRRRPLLLGFADYVRLKWHVRHRSITSGARTS
jgi:hypothetical protein